MSAEHNHSESEPPDDGHQNVRGKVEEFTYWHKVAVIGVGLVAFVFGAGAAWTRFSGSIVNASEQRTVDDKQDAKINELVSSARLQQEQSAHLHEDVRDMRLDLRMLEAGRPLPALTPEPVPAARPTPSPFSSAAPALPTATDEHRPH